MAHRWQFVTGSASKLAPIWRSYDVSSTVSPNGSISHIPAVYVSDPSGGERDVLLVAPGRATLGAETRGVVGLVRPLLPAARS